MSAPTFSLSALTLGLATAGLVSALSSESTSTESSTGEASATQVCGRRIYIRNCAPCHGTFGLGDGTGAEVLEPRPRDFSQGRFRLVSTENGIPTHEDLIEVITRGIVGSAMPPHDHLTLDERTAVADFVQVLTRNRRAEILQALALEDGEELAWDVALEQVYQEPGKPVTLPAALNPTPELLAEGRDSYTLNCAPCHDANGSGRSRTDLLDEQGQPIFARDFTAGVFKGGSSQLDLFRRIRCGMPGSPMPGFDLSDRETWALVHHVESLLQPGARGRLAQVHTEFQPQRIAGTLDSDPGAECWSQIPAQWVVMAPLQWTAERVDDFSLQIGQDDTTLGFRLVWQDSTPGPGEENSTPDSATIRFSSFDRPQFFCPGREDETEEYWEWDARAGDFTYAPLGVSVESRSVDGRYELVFLRKLEVAPERVGTSASGVNIAFEIRNGAAGDPDRSQNITVWHRLASDGVASQK